MDQDKSILGGLIVGALLAGVAVWWAAPVGPNSGPKEMPTPCAELQQAYLDVIELLMQVSPWDVQAENRIGFDFRYLEPQSGVVYVDGPDRRGRLGKLRVHIANPGLIEDEWQPAFEEAFRRVNDRERDCALAFPEP